MLLKLVSLFLVCLMINVAGVNLAFANDSNAKTSSKREAKIKKRAAEIKAGINKLGVGKDSIVRIKLRDKTKIKGYISQIGEDSFSVTDTSGNTTVVEYTKARQVKGNNLNKGVWIAIGVGIGFLILVLLKWAAEN
jgi:uncharacterized integral membrane protein